MAKTMVTPAYRCMYPSLATPKVFKGGKPEDAKFGVKLLIPKKDKEGYKAILDLVAASVAECGDWKDVVKQQVLKTAKYAGSMEDGPNDNAILKDGDLLNAIAAATDKEQKDAYTGHWVLGLGRKGTWGAPLVVGQDGQEIQSAYVESSILSGYWVRAQIQPYCYAGQKNGVTLKLLGVQLVRKDKVFGQSNPFTPVEDMEGDNGNFEE
jgi:hypothetical protein